MTHKHKFLVMIEVESSMDKDLVAKGLAVEADWLWTIEPTLDGMVTDVQLCGHPKDMIHEPRHL